MDFADWDVSENKRLEIVTALAHFQVFFHFSSFLALFKIVN